MLQPSANWSWYLHPETKILFLELEDMLFSTAYHQRQLLVQSNSRHPFSIDDHHFYSKMEEVLVSLQNLYSDARLTQMALNATAVNKFYRPIMPKSWFFSKHQYSGQNNGLSILENDLNQGLVMIIEKDKNSSLCMLIGKPMQLDEHSQLEEFAVIKVMNEYLLPYLS